MEFYFIFTNRRDEDGRLVSGTVKGVPGFRNGVCGPLSRHEANRYRALMGGEVLTASLSQDQVQALVAEALDRAGIDQQIRSSDFDEGENVPDTVKVSEGVFDEATESLDDLEDQEGAEAPEDAGEEGEEGEDEPTGIEAILSDLGTSLDHNATDAADVIGELPSEEAVEQFVDDEEGRLTVLRAAGRDV